MVDNSFQFTVIPYFSGKFVIIPHGDLIGFQFDTDRILTFFFFLCGIIKAENKSFHARRFVISTRDSQKII